MFTANKLYRNTKVKMIRNYKVKRTLHDILMPVKTFRKSGFEFKFNLKKHMDLNEEDSIKVQELQRFQSLQWFVEVVRNKNGDSFGELALMQKEKR